MSFTRSCGLMLAIAPAIWLADGNAIAAPNVEAAPDFVPPPSAIHQGADGRYRVDTCDKSQRYHCMSNYLMPVGWKPGDSLGKYHLPFAGVTGLAPSDVQGAYKLPSSAAAGGKIVAILDTADSNAYTDLTAYRQTFNLSALPKCTGNPTGTTPCFAQVAENGGPSTGGDSAMNDTETSLDMDMISAACPDCSILLVELNNLTNADIVAGVNTAVNLGALAVSISIGGPEATDPSCGNPGPDTDQFTVPGHLVVAASGDFGYALMDQPPGCSSPSYPASATTVLSVGGTTLFNKGGSWDEAVWNDGTLNTTVYGQDVTTSGCSTEFTMPAYQSTALAGSGCSKRASADVSAAASFASAQGQAIPVYCTMAPMGPWAGVEGTSASAPLVAAMLVRLGLIPAISANMGWLYSHPSAFNDLGSPSYPADTSGATTDSNTGACGKLCTIGPGWDGPSGMGTPNGPALLAAAGSGSSSGGGSGSSSGTSSDAGSSSGGSGSSSGAGSSSGSSSGAASSSGFVDGGSDGGFGNNALGGSNSGCGCRTASPSALGSGALATLGVLGLVVARRRRRR